MLYIMKANNIVTFSVNVYTYLLLLSHSSIFPSVNILQMQFDSVPEAYPAS